MAATAPLDAVPRTELMGYLLTSGAHVENVDLTVFTAVDPNLIKGVLHASADELTEVLDARSSDDFIYL